MEKKRIIKYSPEVAKLKIQSYCAYQERSHDEVKKKLYSLGLFSKDVNEIMASLITDNYLNEERFAEAYTSGKIRIKGWGLNKIKYQLRAKKVSDANIKHALKHFDEKEYLNKLFAVAEKKWNAIKEKDLRKKAFKLKAFLLGKGFETDKINLIINKFTEIDY